MSGLQAGGAGPLQLSVNSITGGLVWGLDSELSQHVLESPSKDSVLTVNWSLGRRRLAKDKVCAVSKDCPQVSLRGR